MDTTPTWHPRYLIGSLYGPAINTAQWEVAGVTPCTLSEMKAEVAKQVGTGGFTSGAIFLLTPGSAPILAYTFTADREWIAEEVYHA